MKTAMEIIQEIDALPPEERQAVIDYAKSIDKEDALLTRYSEEDVAKLDHDLEEALRGVNVETFSSMREARKSLGLT